MAAYDYRCERCGTFEVARPLGAAAALEPCPGCGAPAARVFAAPALTAPRSPLRRAQEATDRTAHEPAVHRGPPPARATPRRARPVNPLQARLPRP